MHNILNFLLRVLRELRGKNLIVPKNMVFVLTSNERPF
jgi:hypothetical protein